jgi:preprotein translocase subunit SecD
MNSRLMLWLIIALIIGSLYVDLPKPGFKLEIPSIKFDLPKPLPTFSFPPQKFDLISLLGQFNLRLGLDLQGGTQLVLETQMDKIPPEDRDNALESSRTVIDRRVNLFGVSEAVVQSSKIGDQRRILVDLPGIKDASQAADLVGKTAQLEFREIGEASESAYFPTYENTKPAGLTGADLKKADVTFNQSQGGTQTGPQVSVQFTEEGAKKFADITSRNVGNILPIFLDNELISAPVVQQTIEGGDAVITGQYTTEEAKAFSVQLNAGALPVPIKIIEQRSIGATLGQESINRSVVAGAIGLLVVMTYMVAYYGWLGLIASLVLIIYSLFVLAIFKTGLFIMPPVTLTLAGIAGFILSIGMAVDANILIFERMKEERRWGKNKKQALELGFRRAWSSIRDSNISSLITAAILYFMGTGPVRGFAVTLAIGVLVSMFTAITVSRTILRLIIK